MKVLLIAHNCQSLTEGLPKAQCVGETTGVDLRVLVPNRWNNYGQLRRPEKLNRQVGSSAKKNTPLTNFMATRSSSIPYKSLDSWRGVASIWVVMYHSTMPASEVHSQLQSSLWFVISHRGNLGVFIFFVLSGYCIANAGIQAIERGAGLRVFLYARFRRIYPPFWFSAILFFFLSATASLLAHSGRLRGGALAAQDVLHQKPLYYVANLTLTQRPFHQELLQGVYWTLGYEVAFYALVAMAMLKGGSRSMLNRLHILTVLSLSMLLMAGNLTFYPLDLWPCFGLGVLVYDLIWNPTKMMPKIAFLLSVGVVAMLGLKGMALPGILSINGCGPYLFCVAFSFVILFLHRFDTFLSGVISARLLSWVGVFSYSLYLTHYMIVILISKAAEMAGLSSSWFLPTQVLILTCSVLFARLFFLFCEKPFIKNKRKFTA